jgi:hypothetical protein
MQPAGQSPQPIDTVTVWPAPSGRISYQADWPIDPMSRGRMPANRGSVARTSATASSAVTGRVAGGAVTRPGDRAGEVPGAGEVAGDGAVEPTGDGSGEPTGDGSGEPTGAAEAEGVGRVVGAEGEALPSAHPAARVATTTADAATRPDAEAARRRRDGSARSFTAP